MSTSRSSEREGETSSSSLYSSFISCPVFSFSVLLTRFFVQPSLFIREKAQILRKTGMKRVLLLGSGYVSGPVVEYLTRDDKTQVTVGEFSKLTNVN